jgi:hypothetical protein
MTTTMTQDTTLLCPAMAAGLRPQWGHMMTMIDHRQFVMYGGQAINGGTTGGPAPRLLVDLYLHNLGAGSWMCPINCNGMAWVWHTANFLLEKHLLLCFRGEVLYKVTGRFTKTYQVMVLDTKSEFCVHIRCQLALTSIVFLLPPFRLHRGAFDLIPLPPISDNNVVVFTHR